MSWGAEMWIDIGALEDIPLRGARTVKTPTTP